jgi:hypothetical protein
VLLDVHHRSYARLGAELPADLEVLCRPCHGAEHGKNADPRWSGWTWELVGVIAGRLVAGLNRRAA